MLKTKIQRKKAGKYTSDYTNIPKAVQIDMEVTKGDTLTWTKAASGEWTLRKE